MFAEITRENRVRRHLRRLDCRLVKNPVRTWQREYRGVGYEVYYGNTVVLGRVNQRYEATLADVEVFLEGR